MTTLDSNIPATKKITLVRNSRKVTIRVARTTETEKIMRAVRIFFGLCDEKCVVLLDESNFILVGDLPVFFWLNDDISPTYRVAIPGDEGLLLEHKGTFRNNIRRF